MVTLPDGYQERTPRDIDMVARLADRYKNAASVMPRSQRNIYQNLVTKMRERVELYRGFPKQIHKPTVVDVGCGLGIGSNILSQESQFVWGIDSNPDTIEFARQMFERQPNNIYYTPQLSFDVVDALADDRGFMTFDFVVCVEVIEHIPAASALELVKFLNRLFKRDKSGAYLETPERTVAYISTPNRNHPDLGDTTPNNEHHCYEATPGEMYEFLTKQYKSVTIMDEHLIPQDLDTIASPLVYKVEMPYV